jgi:TetR/AcrR family transcriptional regulator, mexJK operon transcriptional repressor
MTPPESRPEDPRVVRTRAAVVAAARTLFMRQGYDRTTMEDIGAEAGVAKRSVYNNYADKSALFVDVVTDVIGTASDFAQEVRSQLRGPISRESLPEALHDLGRRMALSIVRAEVVALRRLLIGEAGTFPGLAEEYFDRAPGAVIEALAAGFRSLNALGLVQIAHPRRAADQFAYLVVGEPLDRAMLVGTIPSQGHLATCAREGVETFLARYSAGSRQRAVKE